MPALDAVVQRARSEQYPLTPAETFLAGAAVFLTGSPQAVSECGADPAVILGFAAHAAAVDPLPTLQLVWLAEADSAFWLSGTSAPVAADVDTLYGIVADGDGIWVVDKTETTNTRVNVIQVDLVRGLFLVNVLAANRQINA